MVDFIITSIFWILAIYGLIELVKSIIYIFTYSNLKADGIYLIIAVKNQQNKIEGFLRSILFRFIYGKEDSIDDIIVVDLDSTDETPKILSKLQNDYNNIKVTNWKECKDIIENIEDTT